jgi:hypothetical protein
MAGCLVIWILTSLQAESGDGIPSWAYALSAEGGEASSAFAVADVLPSFLRSEPQEKNVGQGGDVSDFALNVAAHVRYSIPFGAADRSYIVYGNGFFVVDHYVSWADFFHAGWGLDLELDIFLGKNGPGRNQNPGFNYGVVLMVQTDEYSGSHVNDAVGSTISLNNLTMNSMLIGGKVLHTLGPGFYADGHFAIGAVHYSAVEGTFSGAFVQFRDEILKDTWTFSSQFRGHVGLRLGPFGIVAGLGFRIQAPPHEGARISMNSGAFWTFDMDLGAELGF